MMIKYTSFLLVVMMMSCQGQIATLGNQNQVSTEDQALFEMASTYLFSLPASAKDENHPLSDELVQLGKELYNEKAISLDKTVSCNTCHPLTNYGVDNLALSKGVGGKLGSRNSPSTYNAALHLAQFWDGREPDVEAQAGGPILNPVEMAMASEKDVIDRLSKIQEYKEMFSKAFPNENKAITYNNLKKAIGAYERKLITPSKFDKYILGEDNALNEEEKKGLPIKLKLGRV